MPRKRIRENRSDHSADCDVHGKPRWRDPAARRRATHGRGEDMNGQVAIYARVSSEKQAESHTIDSQLAALKERVAADGFELLEELLFIDNGYSGTTLIRPGLERLRDAAAMGAFD